MGKKYAFFVLLLSIFQFAFMPEAQSSADLLGIDHAIPSPGQLSFQASFVQEHFLDASGKVSAKKVRTLLRKLKKEDIPAIKRDAFETRLHERLFVEMEPDKDKALKNAKKESKKKRNRYLFSYRLFLIPVLEKILHRIEVDSAGESTSSGNDASTAPLTDLATDLVVQGLIDDFVRHYSATYYPNASRSIFSSDTNYLQTGKFLRGITFNRTSKKYIPAINLIAGKHAGVLSKLLGRSVDPKDYLSSKDYDFAAQNGFDGSLLNPGVSAYWNFPGATAADRLPRRRAELEALFPRSDEKITIGSVRLTGNISPKVNASFERDGKRIKVRIKFGNEVYAATAASHLRTLLGHHQGVRVYRAHQKLWLGKLTYENFVAQFTWKYGESNFLTEISGHGIENGEHWIEVPECSMTLSPKDQIRLGSYQAIAFDNRDRREWRADLVAMAWLNTFDDRVNNYKTLLKRLPETQNSKSDPLSYYPAVSFNDVGASLGRSIVVRNVHDLFQEFVEGGVNRFSPSMLKATAKKITIFWNDFNILSQQRFDRTTYDDLKWGARNIARLTEEEILWALQVSGVPEDTALLYKHKLANRRNQLVKAFDLQDEFPLFEVPDFKRYSPSPAIQNGKVVREFAPGTRFIDPDRMNLLTALSGLLSLSMGREIDHFHVEAGLRHATTPEGMFYPMQHRYVGPGIGATLGRSILINSARFNSPEGGHSYTVIDTLGFQIGARSTFATSLKNAYPIFLNGHLQLYQKEIQFIHYASTMKEAVLSPFKPFGFIKNFKDYVANSMKPAESIRIVDSAGFSINGGMSAYETSPVFYDHVATGLSWQSSKPVTFFRNQFGELNVYFEKFRQTTGTLGLEGLDIRPMITDLPLLGLECGVIASDHDTRLYTFSLPVRDELQATSVLTKERRAQEYQDLLTLLGPKGHEAPSSQAHLNVTLQAHTVEFLKRMDYLFAWKRRLHRSIAHTHIELHKDGTRREFVRYSSERHKSTGPLFPDIQKYPVTTRLDRYTTEIEMDKAGRTLLEQGPTVYLFGVNYRFKQKVDQLVESFEKYNSKFSKPGGSPALEYQALPSPEEKPVYPKVSLEDNLYVSPAGVIQLMQKEEPSDLPSLAQAYYAEGYARENPEASLPMKLHHQRMIWWMSRKLVARFKKAQLSWKEVQSHPDRAIYNLGKFFDTLNAPRFGVKLLTALIPEKHLLFTGQVYGIYRNWSANQYDEMLARRRFMAKSWGNIHIDPPIRRFLFEHEKFLPFSTFAPSFVDEQILFGSRPTGLAVWN